MLLAGVAELVDALDLGSSDERVGVKSLRPHHLESVLRRKHALTRCGSVPLQAGTEGPCRGGGDLIAAVAGQRCRLHALSANSAPVTRASFFRKRSRGSRSRSFGHARCCWSHLVCSRRLLDWPALFFNPQRLLSRSRGSSILGGSRSCTALPPARAPLAAALDGSWTGLLCSFSCWSRSLIWPRLGFSWRLGGSWFLTRHRPVHSRARPLGGIQQQLAMGLGRRSMRSVRYACPLEDPGARGCCHRGSPWFCLEKSARCLARCLYVLSLHRRRLYVTLSGDRLLLWRRPRHSAPVAAS